MIRSKYSLICCWQLLFVAHVTWATSNDCQGRQLPFNQVDNPDITCAILIDDELVFPRNIAVSDDQIWLVDKGSNLFNNDKSNGALYRYQLSGVEYQRTKVLANLNDPNDIDVRQHSDGSNWVYFTTRHTVQRFKVPESKSPPMVETIISDLPTYGWHKLVALHLTPQALFLTIPSSSDHCEVEGLPELAHYPCGEENNGTALIRRYKFDGDELDRDFKIIARGLRDALAVLSNIDQSKLLLADNGWDQIDLKQSGLNYDSTPADELNVVDLSQQVHFGWPYCYDNQTVTPPYRRFEISCVEYQSPLRLLDAHSAPLAMIYYNDQLLINLHGSGSAGGKTIAFSVDKSGMPVSEASTKIDWRALSSSKPRPLGLAKTSKNHLLISDDWNHQLIKLVFEQ